MGSALPLDLLIDITSTGVKDAFTIGKLNTILIETSSILLLFLYLPSYFSLTSLKYSFIL